MKLFLVLSLLMCNAFGATTLKDAFESSRKNMETLRRSSAELQASVERKNQARAGLMPTISGVGNDLHIDKPKATGVNSAFILTHQYAAGLRLVQPLLRGGIVSGLQSRNEEVLLAEFQKNSSELNLYQLVINAYYSLHFARMDLKNLAEFVKYAKDRVKELKGFTAVGRSRKAELVLAETQQLSAEAQYRGGEMALNQAVQNFIFYTGMEPGELAPLTMIPKDLPSLTDYTEKLHSRPDLLARQQQVVVADKLIDVAKGGHYPSVDFVSNYYLDRTGILKTSEWDVGLLVTVPLFQGGSVIAQTRTAVENKRIAELNSNESVRTARRDIAILYQNYYQMQSQIKVLREAMQKSEEGWKLNQKDYRNGLVTNLEVLQSLTAFIDAKRAYDNQISQIHLTYKSLEASIGVLP